MKKYFIALFALGSCATQYPALVLRPVSASITADTTQLRKVVLIASDGKISIAADAPVAPVVAPVIKKKSTPAKQKVITKSKIH